MEEQLPYRAEYAKSGRAGCKSCKAPIPKDSLRLAAMVQSTFFDGKMPNWYHWECFFMKQRPKSVGDIAHFHSLRWEDQENIKKRIEAIAAGGADVTASANGKSKAKGKKRGGPNPIDDFCVEYAKSARAMCRGCEQKIMKDEVRISKKDYESDVGKRYGGQALWHHVECFAKLRNDLEFWDSGSALPGLKTLKKEDQQFVLQHLPKIDVKPKIDEVDGVAPIKKPKLEPEDSKLNDEIKKQSKIIFKYRDALKQQQLKKKELVALLERNKQDVPPGNEEMLDRLADIMTFGRLLPCKECNGGQFVFRSGVGYQCTGNVSEWVKCANKTLDPPRGPFKVPQDLKESFPILESYKYVPRKRIINIVAPSSSSSIIPNYPVKSETGAEHVPKVKRAPPPLSNMEFVINGISGKEKDSLKEKINKLGGKISSKIHPMVFAVISNEDEVERMGSKLKQAQELDIHVVPASFADAVKSGESALTVLEKTSISSWGSNAKKRIHAAPEPTKSRFTSESMFKSKSGTVKLKLKEGLAVDPDSGLQDIAHVYRNGKNIYNSALCLTDIQSDKNSYYKLQVLEADKGQSYWVFRSWGRIGTTVGGHKVEKTSTLHEAKALFESLFQDKTGNPWEQRDHFVKISGKMCPMEVDYGGSNKTRGLNSESQVKSKLPLPIQDLIKTIFDVETMKRCMMEFELDLEKMPLGKLSKRQLLEAYSVLKDAIALLTNDSKLDVKSVNANAKLLEYSNRFFTLVPHDFGILTPPLLNTPEIVKSKMDVLDSLLEIEIAYNMLDEAGESSIDAQYEKLKADMEVVDKNSDEFNMLQLYVKNTHAATHNQYSLEIEEVFKVRRHGEDRKYKPFKKLNNRKLLWHGSRLTNYAGILSQGLRIAPPEAPVTGYMFGKGIYFADMVSKSANYCMTSRANPIGYMLLCEVALGNMYEKTRADYITKLPKGMNSCKGVGKTSPDPSKSVILEDGVEVPLGPSVTNLDLDTTLLYNEYIVYDVAQVKCQYLFKMRFKHV